MTRIIKRSERARPLTCLRACLYAAVAFTVVYLSPRLSVFVKEGLALSFNVIIPSLFPFMLLTDFLSSGIMPDKEARIGKIYESLFKLESTNLPVTVLGILGGFPIGAKLAADRYKLGKMSKSDLERLVLISTNASPAYVIFAVGVGLLNSLYKGIFLYIIMLSSCFITGIVLGVNKPLSQNIDIITRQRYIFSESVKSSFYASINVAAFICTFSVINGALATLIDVPCALALLFPFLEIGNAASYLSDLYILSERLSLSLIAFSISFSGLSVISQVASVLSDTDAKIHRIAFYKLVVGVLAFLLSFLLFPIL